MHKIGNIWKFETEHFTITVDAYEEEDLDLSWDEDGKTLEGLQDGELIAFCAVAKIYANGAEVGSDALGNCIYRSLDDFRDHFGIKPYERLKSAEYGSPVICGSYFSGMVRECIDQARKFEMPALRQK